MKKSYFIPFIAAGLLVSSCSKENPFDSEYQGEGQFLRSALSMSIADESRRQAMPTRAEANVDDFTVIFTKDGEAQPVAKYLYGEMPEVIVLPAGTYTCTATYGEDRQAEWDSPYYEGKSETFDIIANEINSYVEPIVCRLANVMVSIDFDYSLRQAMSSDSYVEVKVGSSSSLNYGVAEADASKAGYFQNKGETTLTAVFHGTVNGAQTVETKTLDGVVSGNHYRITFKLHAGDNGDGSGDVDGTVSTDASVTIIDVERNIEISDDDEILDDSERPTEGSDENPEQPGGDDPTPPVSGEAPTIEGLGSINLDGVNINPEECSLVVKSTADGGITGFTCEITSTNPDFDVTQASLDPILDLVNPGEMEGPLEGLGFPVNIGGQKEVTITIQKMFLDMLCGSFDGIHSFVLTVTDANGTTVKTLKISNGK